MGTIMGFLPFILGSLEDVWLFIDVSPATGVG